MKITNRPTEQSVRDGHVIAGTFTVTSRPADNEGRFYPVTGEFDHERCDRIAREISAELEHAQSALARDDIPDAEVLADVASVVVAYHVAYSVAAHRADLTPAGVRARTLALLAGSIEF